MCADFVPDSCRRTSRRSGRSVPGAENANLFAVAADAHRAPLARVIPRLVVEGPVAIVRTACLEPQPAAILCSKRDRDGKPAERAGKPRRRRLGRESSIAVMTQRDLPATRGVLDDRPVLLRSVPRGPRSQAAGAAVPPAARAHARRPLGSSGPGRGRDRKATRPALAGRKAVLAGLEIGRVDEVP